MNRTVVIGGVVAVAVLLGVAAWFLMSGGPTRTPTGEVAGEPEGPVALNPVAVVTDHSASETEDGRTLSITFPSFELAAKAGETTSAVFSTTWRLKLGPDERAVVAAATIDGYMKSAGAPQPAIKPVAAPAPAAAETAPAESDATPPEEGAASAPAEQPAKPAAPAPVRPVAGAGTARIIVSFGSEASVIEWRDTTGEGAPRRVAKALAFTGGPDMRLGGKVPVTVTVEVSGGNATETLARINKIDLRLFAEDAPLPKPEPAPAATGETADGATPAEGAAPSEPGAADAQPAGSDAETPAEQPESPTP